MKKVLLSMLAVLVVIIAITGLVCFIINMISPNVIVELIGCIATVVLFVPPMIVGIINLLKK